MNKIWYLMQLDTIKLNIINGLNFKIDKLEYI